MELWPGVKRYTYLRHFLPTMHTVDSYVRSRVFQREHDYFDSIEKNFYHK